MGQVGGQQAGTAFRGGAHHLGEGGALAVVLCGDIGLSSQAALTQEGLPTVSGLPVSADLTAHAPLSFLSAYNAIVMPRGAFEPALLALATGQINPKVAILIVDASQGLTSQDCRDCVLMSTLGIRHLVLAVDNMETVNFDERAYNEIVNTCSQFVKPLSFSTISSLPLSFPHDENFVQRTDNLAWYRGPTLLASIAGLQSESESRLDQPLRLPARVAQSSSGQGFTYSGTIASGRLKVGDIVRIQPGGRSSRVKTLHIEDHEVNEALDGDTVILALQDTIEATGAYVLCGSDCPGSVADQFEAHLIWAGNDALLPGRGYPIEIAGQAAVATITAIKYKLKFDTLEQLAATRLEANEMALVTLSLDRFVAFDAYTDNKMTGSMVFFDGQTKAVVAVGMIRFALRRSHNIHLQHLDIDKRNRAQQKRQEPRILWLTGLSGAGKSTIANLVEKKLFQLGRHTYLLDGDNVRHGLNRDLGFTEADRVENIRRVAEVAKLMVDAGLIVITAFISPFRAERAMARSLVATGEFVEIFVDTPIAVAETRDPKGLYKKARRGELKNFTGIDSPYEPPENPEIRISTTDLTAEAAADLIVEFLCKPASVFKS